MRAIIAQLISFSAVFLILQSGMTVSAQSVTSSDLCADYIDPDTVVQAVPLVELEAVQVNLAMRDFLATLPFHQGFLIKGKVPKEVSCIELQVWPNDLLDELRAEKDSLFHVLGKDTWWQQFDYLHSQYRMLRACQRNSESTACQQWQALFTEVPTVDRPYLRYWKRPVNLYADTDEFSLPVLNHLDAGDVYHFVFTLRYARSPQTQTVYSLEYEASGNANNRIPTHLVEGKRLVPDSPRARLDTTEIFIIADTAPASFNSHFNTDFGVLHSLDAGYWGIMSSMHFYPFSPINKKSDLGQFESKEKWAQRISLFAGLSFQELASDRDVENLLGIGTPVVGIGLRGFPYWGKSRNAYYRRIAQPLRFNVGVVWFKQEAANPLVDRMEVKQDLFVSVTADTDLLGILGPFLKGVF